MRRLIAVIKPYLPAGTDVLGVAGASGLLYGIAQVHRPSAWIAGGVLALTAAVLLARKEA